MRKLVVNAFLTLDGVMQAPGGPEEDTSGEFAYGGWSVKHWDETMAGFMGEVMGKPFDLVLGRKTYEIFAAYWPHATEEQGAKPLNEARKHVASRTLDSVEWANSVLIEGDVVEYIAALKQQDGPELQVHGSSDLLQTILETDLIDRFNLMMFPVIVGSGKRLFRDGTLPTGLELVHSTVSTTGVVICTYERAGEVPTGSFGLD